MLTHALNCVMWQQCRSSDHSHLCRTKCRSGVIAFFSESLFKPAVFLRPALSIKSDQEHLMLFAITLQKNCRYLRAEKLLEVAIISWAGFTFSWRHISSWTRSSYVLPQQRINYMAFKVGWAPSGTSTKCLISALSIGTAFIRASANAISKISCIRVRPFGLQPTGFSAATSRPILNQGIEISELNSLALSGGALLVLGVWLQIFREKVMLKIIRFELPTHECLTWPAGCAWNCPTYRALHAPVCCSFWFLYLDLEAYTLKSWSSTFLGLISLSSLAVVFQAQNDYNVFLLFDGLTFYGSNHSFRNQ